MLKKLIRHEWKSIWKVPTVLVVLLQGLAVLAGLNFAIPIWNLERMTGLGFLMAGVIMLFYFGLIGASIGITIYLAVRFYKSMFTDEGYLTHTLPVSPRQLLISKGIVMAAWVMISNLAMFLSMSIFGGLAYLFLFSKNDTFFKELSLMLNEMNAQLGYKGISILILTVTMMIAGSLSSTAIMFSGMTIGQLYSRHRIAGSIAAYIGIAMIVQILCVICIAPVMIKNIALEASGQTISALSMIVPMFIIIMAVSILIAVVMYFISEFIITKKLNLE